MTIQFSPQTQHFERLANVVALPIGRWDSEARLLFCNTPYLAWSGRSHEQLLGRTLHELFGVEAWAAAKPAFERAFGGEISGYQRLLTHPPHSPRWARIQVFPDVDRHGTVTSVFTIATDIHQDIVERDALIAARKRLDRFTDNIRRRSSISTATACCASSTKAWCQLVSMAAEDALGRHVSEVRGVASWLEQKPYYETALAGTTTHFHDWCMASSMARAGCAPATFPIPTRTAPSSASTPSPPTSTDLTIAQEQLRRSVERDALTDALSRHTMMSFIECSIADPNLEYALFFIDLDGFKAVNDEKGTMRATACWPTSPPPCAAPSAPRMRSAASAATSSSCWPGCTGQAGAQALAEHLRATVEEVAQRSGDRVSASIGYALSPSDSRDPMQLLHHADEAMYIAKRNGKNCVMPWAEVRRADPFPGPGQWNAQGSAPTDATGSYSQATGSAPLQPPAQAVQSSPRFQATRLLGSQGRLHCHEALRKRGERKANPQRPLPTTSIEPASTSTRWTWPDASSSERLPVLAPIAHLLFQRARRQREHGHSVRRQGGTKQSQRKPVCTAAD